MNYKLKELLSQISGDSALNPSVLRECVQWPPDAFAMASTFLEVTGTYRKVISPPSGMTWPPNSDWNTVINETVKEWHENLNEQRTDLPAFVNRVCDTTIDNLDVTLSELAEKWDVVSSFLSLHSISDQACAEFGTTTPPPIRFLNPSKLLLETGSLSRFPVERVRVLPKQRTPQSGIGLRSLSYHVAAVRSEVRIQWLPLPNRSDWTSLEILILPWPLVIKDSDFQQVKTQPLSTMDEKKFGFFEFNPDESPNVELILDLVQECYRLNGPEELDLVVFPEAALSHEQLKTIQQALNRRFSRPPAILAGVRMPATDDNFGKNQAILAMPPLDSSEDSWSEIVQDKHHRWLIDEAQIRNYRLGVPLHPKRRWWEATEVPPRTLGLFDLGEGLLLCPLVCEDLARQDPVASYVRSIGPSLIIALLLDGPQLSGRWSGRYAAVLADDPGSSVLTLSSYGMVRRSIPPGLQPSHCVALWKDAINREKQIDLPETHQGILLTITRKQKLEWTADGRPPLERKYLVFERAVPLSVDTKLHLTEE